MKLRYAGTCRLCGAELSARTEAIYERSTKTVRCLECPTHAGGPVVLEESGVAGASARREYERRKAKDEERLRQRWGRLGGILRPRAEKVLVGRRDCTGLVDGVLKQVDLVRGVVGDVPVTGALCFVEADWPLVGGAFTTRGVHVLWPRRLAKLLTEESGTVDVAAVREVLVSRFKPA